MEKMSLSNRTTNTLQQALGSLSTEDIHQLKQVAVRKKYSDGVVVCQEGELEHTFYVIESGMVSVSRRLKNLQEQVLNVLGDGQFFGEMGLLDSVPRAATIRTLTKCTLIEISEDTFDKVVKRNPAVAITLLKGITRSLRQTDLVAVSELEAKNQKLAQALNDLKATQAKLLQQERLKRDLEIASDVQKSILPSSFPKVSRFEFGFHAHPAREVGGDFYDVIKIDDNNFALVVADVSGKSWNAAIFMAIVRALLLRETDEKLSPLETLERLHHQIIKTSTAEMYVTMFYGVINIKQAQMKFVRAGHEYPILYRHISKTLEMLDPPGRFVGLWPGLLAEEAEITILPGDCLVCYSDGVTDAENDKGEFFGLEQLLALINAKGHLPPQELVDYIVQEIDNFSGNVPQTDDITILVAKLVE